MRSHVSFVSSERKDEGMTSGLSRTHDQAYNMNAKINEKELKCLAGKGTADCGLGMLTPHRLDRSVVKKEHGCVTCSL